MLDMESAVAASVDDVDGDFEYKGRPPELAGGRCVAVVLDRIVAVPVAVVDVSEGPGEGLKPLTVSGDRLRKKTGIVADYRFMYYQTNKSPSMSELREGFKNGKQVSQRRGWMRMCWDIDTD